MRRRFRIKDDWSFEELIEASRDLAEGEHIFSGAQYNAHRIRIEEKIRTFLTGNNIAFDASFHVSVELVQRQSEYEITRSKRVRASLNREIGALENRITPGAKRAAIERNRPLLSAARIHIAASTELNIAETVGHLSQPVACRDKQPRRLTDRTKRNLITQKIGVKGQPGRKRRGP